MNFRFHASGFKHISILWLSYFHELNTELFIDKYVQKEKYSFCASRSVLVDATYLKLPPEIKALLDRC
jgi:hypothetical protein